MKGKLFIFPVLIVLISCELVVDIDVPAPPDLLVVNCVFDAHGHWKAHISQSKSVYDLAFYPYFEDAVFYVTRPDGSGFMIAGDSLPDGFSEPAYNYTFTDNEPIAYNLPYKITVVKDGFPQANSETIILKPVKIKSFEIDTTQIDRNNDGFIAGSYDAIQNDLIVKFIDLSEENYYALRLKVINVYKNQYNDSIWQSTVMGYVGLETNNTILEEYIQYSNELLFSDKTFAGQEFEIKAKYSKYVLENAVSLTIELCTVPREYYLYRHTQKQQNWVEGDPFAEPVTVKGNIENGYGIFAGISKDTVNIAL